MTLPALYSQNRYWKDHPPVHILVAAYLGYKPPKDLETGEDFDEFLDALGASGMMEEKK